jgi:hypothetical protein
VDLEGFGGEYDGDGVDDEFWGGGDGEGREGVVETAALSACYLPDVCFSSPQPPQVDSLYAVVCVSDKQTVPWT